MTVKDFSADFLLQPDEPAPFRTIENSDIRWLIVCDHASNRIPLSLGTLGINEEARADHIAWDIGAAKAAERLAERLCAPAVLANYSRLVIDCNRYPDMPEAAPQIADGIVVAGNAELSLEDLARRAAEIAHPYHLEIARRIDYALDAGTRPILLSIHSCTAVMDGAYRPWHIGLAWERDERLSRPVLDALERNAGVPIGANEPYDLELGGDFTTPEHAMARGLAHLQVEFRNDLVANDAGAIAYADLLADAVIEAVSIPSVAAECAIERNILAAQDPIRFSYVTN